ncbi:MAG: filamentous hemagglutinin N-terminal domain-containing protein, partial [Methylococcales bacterium]|nr:filamentous hemagglutinin N-terminal domain-containing protein [Methylococcales bacterium]
QGRINANGQVYLVNPNGVVFSKTAQVDVGGLVATTHNIKDADFIAGKNHFTQDGASGTVANHGTINVPNGGVVALIGEQVSNTGTINTPKGTTALAAGKTVDLDFKGDGLVEVKVSEAALNAQITNQGAIQADGGRVVLTAKAANSLIDSVINQEGVIKAQGLTERNGEIILDGGYVAHTGTLDASGNTGGKIAINARAILDAGKTNADGTAGNGGTIKMQASDAIIQTASADTHANGTTQGGTVHLEATNSVYSSGKIAATGDTGGTINVLSNDRVVLAAADIDASGTNQGGLVRIGGDFHGANPNINNAKTTIINGASNIKANGGKGKVVVWSDTQTDYDGTISANKAGEIEVSSKGLLNYAGRADAGVGGSLLLDPKNIVIAANAGVANYALLDPRAAAGNGFGANTTLLTYGNMVVSSPFDDFAATNAGAVYLFNTTTGALLSALTGSGANDNIGFGLDGITALSNGHYLVNSVNWDNGAIINTGAVTWGNGNTGISGIVSASNSLVGSTANDTVGNLGITALQNGNYVVKSPVWDNGAIVNAGAATFGNGAMGTVGAVSASNSLVGVSTADNVGNAVTALSSNNYLVSNSNYVVSSSNWSNGAIQNVGAATFGDGTVGITGIITATNSLIGAIAGDTVSNSGITALSNGNYVVGSSNWDNGAIQNVGAATFANGLTGLSGIVTATNSLTGSSVNDFVSNWGVTALTNGHYVVRSGSWANGVILSVGAVTWGNGNTGISGAISAANSLIGSTAGDAVGGGFGVVTALSNGNYVVGSPNWSNGGVLFTGAATWGNGATGISGTINAANSLIGTGINDFVSSSGITALNNGNYVVGSANWSNGALLNAGAATWGNGSTGIIGTISGINSLIGSAAGDAVSSGGITALIPSNPYSSRTGNYVVSSPNWNNGTIASVGAATWGNGDMGISGIISSTNSLTGSTAFDRVSCAGITPLNDRLSFMFHAFKRTGNYVVSSTNWNNGGNANVGAATWGDGNTGITGIVSTTNSLTGSVAGDFSGALPNKEINYGVVDLHNNNYALHSGSWDNAGLVDAGQVRIVTPENIYFANGIGQTMIFNPSTLAATLALGTNIVLQANNDITLDADINVSGNNGGILTLKAGRNITLNARINTANGNFSAIA